jgi:hypothetical protein
MKHFEKKRALGVVVFLSVFAISIALVMYLWNILLPEIFGAARISYWQSAGLIILSRLLFGGFGQFHRKGFAKCHEKKQYMSKEALIDLHKKIKEMSLSERCEFIRKRMEDMEAEDEEK